MNHEDNFLDNRFVSSVDNPLFLIYGVHLHYLFFYDSRYFLCPFYGMLSAQSQGKETVDKAPLM